MLLNRCLCVTLVYCGQTVGWSKMKLYTEVGLSPGDIVLDGDPAPLPKRSTAQSSAHVLCGQMAGWMKMPLGTEVGLGSGNSVRWGPSSPQRTKAPNFWPMSIVALAAHVCCGQTAGWIKMLLGTEVDLGQATLY